MQRHQDEQTTAQNPRQDGERQPIDALPAGDLFAGLKTREQREAEERAKELAARERLAAAVVQTAGAESAEDLAGFYAARDGARETKPIAKQLAPRPLLTAEEARALRTVRRVQHTKPPPHIALELKKEKEAKKKAQASAHRNGVRVGEEVYWPAWVRGWARRIQESKGVAVNELATIRSRAVIDSITREARPYGGFDTLAGRAVIALAVVAWWVGTKNKGRISGMPRPAWTTLTVGWQGQHYSDSSVWHPVHNVERDLLPPEVHGQKGGRIGDGRNRGFMIAISLSGFMRLLVPAVSASLPPFMVAPSGWPFVQVIVFQDDDAPPDVDTG